MCMLAWDPLEVGGGGGGGGGSSLEGVLQDDTRQPEEELWFRVVEPHETHRGKKLSQIPWGIE